MSIKSRLIIITFIFIYQVIALVTVVDIGVLPLVGNSVGITFFIDITNEDRQRTCKIHSHCIKCCFVDSEKEDCGIVVPFGDGIRTVKPRDRETLLFVTPSLFQHDLVGYCKFLLKYDYNNTKEEIDVTIPFDTQVGIKKSKQLLTQYVGAKKIKLCGTLDENSLNNCEPVDCRIKYLDKRPIFDDILKKCVEVPICPTNPDKELPDFVYVPNSNTCRNLELPLTVQDIYAISTGLGTVTIPSATTSDIKVKVKSNCSTISQNLKLFRDLLYDKKYATDNEITLDYSECLRSALLTIIFCIISICSTLFLLVCCVNYAAWFYVQWSDGNLSEMWKTCKNSLKFLKKRKNNNIDNINTTVRNELLREVIVKDIPLDLRNSVVDVCDRMRREVEKKRRYREAGVGSQVSLQKSRESLLASMSSSISLEINKE